MAANPKQIMYSPEEYLTLELDAEYRSEYIDGQIVAMTGASRAHNLITTNISRELSTQLKSRPCEVYSSDMRVTAGKKRLYTYPDVVVVCGEPKLEDDQLDTLLNPTVLFEVLSHSTEAYDRGVKFSRYRELASLQEYLLVSQDAVFIEHYVRQGETWVLSVVSRIGADVYLPSIDCNMAINEIYDKVAFSPPDEESV